MSLTFGTVCSGIGAPERASLDLGWRCSFMSEIEKFPRAVLKAHYPHHPLHGDFTTIGEKDYEPNDVLIGGTPCQDFSVAGKRLGMDAPRGNLALEYLSLARRRGTRWLVWENVPGILSSWSDDSESFEGTGRGETRHMGVYQRNDFATFLEYVGQCGYGFAWRVLDGQYFGVPQRRRRVILVGYLGDWRPAAAVLFDGQSLRRDLTPRREARTGIARSLTSSTGGVCAKEQQHTFIDGSGNPLNDLKPFGVPDVAWALQERDSKGTDSDTKDGHLIPMAHEPIAFGCKEYAQDDGDISPPLRAMGHDTSHENGGGQVAIAFESRFVRNGRGAPSDLVPPLKAQSGETGKGDAAPLIAMPMMVRRLTPVECEFLMGFPRNYTLITFNKKPAKDGPRYKALGNSMIVPKMKWILTRLDQVNRIINP